MIEYIKGSVEELTPTYVVLETGGIGYMLNISLMTYAKLEGQKQTRLLVYESIREDAHTLYGFAERAERSLFEQLIGVSGVGANTARMILSSYSTADLEQLIVSGDHKRLTAVKGIGAKTAQRIIVDLKDKIKLSGDVNATAMSPASTETYDEALAALVMLGFPRPASQKVLTRLFTDDPAIRVEAAIKRALTML